MRFLNSRTLRYFGQRARELAHNFENAHHPYEERQGGRSWEDYYRRRWQHFMAQNKIKEPRKKDGIPSFFLQGALAILW